MSSKFLQNAFETSKLFIWNHTHKDPAKMLIAMGALGFALSSLAQCFAIKINNKIDKKKKNFMLTQEAADGVVNIGLFLGITSGVWKYSDKMIKFLGVGKGNAAKITAPNPNPKNHIKSGGRLLTTIIASVIACNVVTPLIRNYIAGKLRNYYDKKSDIGKKVNYEIPSIEFTSPFKNFETFSNPSINKYALNSVQNMASLKI